MNWLDEVNGKLKKKNQILFSKHSEYLQDLIMLFQSQDHRVMVLWAFDLAAESVAKLETNTLTRKGQGRRWRPLRHGRPEK